MTLPARFPRTAADRRAYDKAVPMVFPTGGRTSAQRCTHRGHAAFGAMRCTHDALPGTERCGCHPDDQET
jgi:hypothetical protein